MIGRASVLLFVQEGTDLVLTAEVAEEIERVATEARALGRTALPLVADMRREEDLGPTVSTAIGVARREQDIPPTPREAQSGEPSTRGERWQVANQEPQREHCTPPLTLRADQQEEA